MAVPPLWFGLTDCSYSRQVEVNPAHVPLLLEKIYRGGLGRDFDPKLQVAYESYLAKEGGKAKLEKKDVRVSDFPGFFSELYGQGNLVNVIGIKTVPVPLHDAGEVEVGEYSRMPFIQASISSGLLEIKGANNCVVKDTEQFIKSQWFYGL